MKTCKELNYNCGHSLGSSKHPVIISDGCLLSLLILESSLFGGNRSFSLTRVVAVEHWQWAENCNET
jgi:hypothetical protein